MGGAMGARKRLAPKELPETDRERLRSETLDAGHRAAPAVARSVSHVFDARAEELGLPRPDEARIYREMADEMFAHARRDRRGAPLLWNRRGAPPPGSSETLSVVADASETEEHNG